MEPISILGYSLGSIFATYGGCLYYKYRKEIEKHKMRSEAYYLIHLIRQKYLIYL